MPTTFPPVSSNTTDAVRLKCRELLSTAVRGDGGIFLFCSHIQIQNLKEYCNSMRRTYLNFVC